MPTIRPDYLQFGTLVNNRLFRIPDYQRAYSWRTEERRDLFEDIMKVRSKETSEHFMSTMVALRRDKKLIGTDEYQISEIVDGQQRLTTLIILLKAIEQTLGLSDKSQERTANDLRNLLVKPEADALLLLQTNHDTSHFFSNYLRDGTHPQPHEADTIADRELLRAIDESEKFVDSWKNDAPLMDLLALLKNRLTFVLHEIEDEGTAYNTFEVLNSRGLVVSALDRLKSKLMGTAFELNMPNKQELINELHHLWGDIYRVIGLRQGMSTEALRFAATLRSGECPSRSLGEEDAVGSLQGIATNAKSIRDTAQWLLTVTKACDANIENRRLNAVTRISQARLLATALRLRADLSPEQAEQLFRPWEKITFRIYGLARNDARTRVGEYVRLAWQTVNEKLSYKDIRDQLNKIGSTFPIKDALDKLRENDCYSNWGEELRYFFFRYEEHLAREQGQNFSNDQWERIWIASASESIEHIWPQSKAPSSEVHRLGNLILLPPKLNSKLKDMSPAKKREPYIKTGLLIAEQVASKLKTTWGKASIDAREKALLKWAETEWG